MRLAAIYFENHEYFFDKPQTVNFGGNFIYEFAKDGDKIIVTKETNNKFVEGFFDLMGLKSKLTNLNAIVGQNGAGKSTILDLIRSKFVKYPKALPNAKSLLLVEVEGNKHPLILKNDFDEIFIMEENGSHYKIIELVQKKVQTIYYSPHFDYKFNAKFNVVDDHDLSFDVILREDLNNINIRTVDENGVSFSPNQELLFKNSIRQIEFLNSDLVKKKKIFNEVFDFQDHYDPILYFRGYKTNIDNGNTPQPFRIIINQIDRKLDQEIDKWGEIERNAIDKFGNGSLAVYQYLLRRNILKHLLSVIIGQMEKSNMYIGKGHLLFDITESANEEVDAYGLFLLFIKNSFIRLDKTDLQVFRYIELQSLLNKIYSIIDRTSNLKSITKESIRVSSEDAIEILNLQRIFLLDLGSYYVKFYSNRNELIINDRDKIEPFIDYMPFSRRMSSGETSLLNFYSRIHNYLNSKLPNLQVGAISDHYILLLDEADLTFHIKWKKKFVKALLKTLPYFFEKLDKKPSIEIIMTTHDPIALSDLPNHNVIYLERKDYNSSPNILKLKDNKRPTKTFGANISELIADSFFIEDSLIGDFAVLKIQDAIEWLNIDGDLEKQNYFKRLIMMIDEPIVQRKLAEMYDEKLSDNFQIEIIDEQIKKLEELKKKLN